MNTLNINGTGESFLVEHPKIVMSKNLQFLAERYIDVLQSSIDIVDDILNIAVWTRPDSELPGEEQKITRPSEIVSRYLMYPTFLHVVFPNALFLITQILLGAIPHAFYTLRTMLEAFAIALYADCKDELENLSVIEKVEHPSVRNATLFRIKDSLKNIFVERLGEEVAEMWVDYILDLYQGLSAWVHPVARIKFEKDEYAAGVLKAVIEAATWRETPPVYAFMIPGGYVEEDIEDLRRLNDGIVHTRLAITLLVYVWSIDKPWVDLEAIEKRLEDLLRRRQQTST